jgi:hypothetical protein
MALKRIEELTLNNERTPGKVLLRSLADPSPATKAWIEDDKFKTRLRFADLPTTNGGVATAVRLDPDNVIILGARANRGTGSSLFGVTDFVETVVEADEEAGTPADYYYDAVLNIDTSAMESLFGSNPTALVWVDVEVQAPDSEGGDDPDRLTWQFQVSISRQAYAGDALPAGPTTITYPAPGLLALRMPASSNYRIIPDGAGGSLLQIVSATSGKFHTLLVAGAEGEEALTIGPPEV